MTFLRLDLWWVPVAILVAIVGIRRLVPRRSVAVTTIAWLADPVYRASATRHVPLGLCAGALALALCGLLQPARPLVQREVRIQGLDIVLVIDLSFSMMQPIGFTDNSRGQPAMTAPVRIDAVKQALRTFIQRRPSDRIGVVVFSDNSYVVSPLTLDHEHLLDYFSLIDPRMLVGEGMTAIGDGIDAGMQLLRRQSTSERRNKVLMVFTDGVSNRGRNPLRSLEDATRSGTRVHVVGVDLEQEIKQSAEATAFVEAVQTRGGRYYAAESPAQLDAAASSLDELEQGEARTTTYLRNEPLVQWMALPALVMLLLAVGLRALPNFIALH
jgi:Ca-activated chloride channel family protein